MFNDVSQMSPTVAILAPLMAKSASVWNPLIYVVKNQDFRTAFTTIFVDIDSTSHHTTNSPIDLPSKNRSRKTGVELVDSTEV